MALTSQCPKNQTEVYEASKQIGCGVDVYGNNRYMCLPNEKKSSLVEFCFDGVMGIEEKGNCLENSNGKIRRYNCTSFSSGCPNISFYKYNVYEYPACQVINSQSNCYVMEPSCPSQEPNGGQNDDTKNDVTISYLILGYFIAICVVVIVLILLLMIERIKRKWKRTLNKGKKPETIKTATQMERIDKLDKKLLTCKEDKSANNENDGIAYACTNYTCLDIGELSIHKKERKAIHYKATTTKDNKEVEISFSASSKLKKEEIILVNKLDGPAIYQFISKGQQETSEQGLSPEMKCSSL